ncbi:MAG: hypothetical protein R3F11_03155 [Verrucomicrobiales bacterium]
MSSTDWIEGSGEAGVSPELARLPAAVVYSLSPRSASPAMLT